MRNIAEVLLLGLMYWMYFWIILQFMFWLTKKFNTIGLIIGILFQIIPVSIMFYIVF
jgi:hypothetical protein